jgi:hypothetical protein
MRSLFVFMVIALAIAAPISARTHQRAAKAPVATVAAPGAVKPANVPEKDRDPADVALDQKIKGICRGC